MTDLIDRIHFEELAQRDPKAVCKRVGCRYDDKKQCYLLAVWGVKYALFPHQQKVDCIDEIRSSLPDYFELFLIHYLLKPKEAEVANEWISEKDVPGGPTFFRGPHEIPTHTITGRFENNLDEFKSTCEQLQGTPLNMADAAYRFDIILRIPVALLYWQGDEDFDAEAKILYDRTITEHLASDVIYALAVGICERLQKPLVS